MMALRATDPSLCMNCVHSGHCVFERTSPTPVMQCDEHRVCTVDVEEVPAASDPERKVGTAPIFAPSGLCITCDHVATCTLRSPDRIVLHCAHYE